MMAACQRVKLSEVITQNTDIERITNTKSEHYITLALYGKGARERHIKDEKYPVPFLGYRVTAGQFIYSRIDARNGAYGIIGKSLDGFVVSKDFPVYNIDTSKILPQFLLRSVLSRGFVEQVKQSSFGATNRMRIKEEVFENYYISLPSLEVQKLIVDRLGRVSAVIASREKEVTLLDELVKARFVELFGDPKYNKNNLVKIGEIGTLTSGGTPSRAKPEYFEGVIRWYSAGELNSLYLPDSVEHISQTALKESSAKLFDKGTLMIGMYDTAAFKLGILTEASSSNQACANLNPQNDYNVVWLYYLFDIMKPIFLQERQGVRQKNLSLSKIREFEVPNAPIELQNQFAAFVAQVNKSKVAVQKALDEAQLLFDSLMQKYFG